MFTQIKHRTPGVLLCLCIALPSWYLGEHIDALKIIGGPVIAILLGIFIGLFHTLKSLYLSDWVSPP